MSRFRGYHLHQPHGSVCWTLYHVFLGVKAFVYLYEVFSNIEALAWICVEPFELSGIDRRNIMEKMEGIRHFPLFTLTFYNDNDFFHVDEDYTSCYEKGFGMYDNSWINIYFHSGNQVKFDLFLYYGLIASAGDRHLVEFIPSDMYLKDQETVIRILEDLKNQFERSERLAKGDEKCYFTSPREEGILEIRIHCVLDRKISIVNIPNNASQIHKLPITDVV